MSTADSSFDPALFISQLQRAWQRSDALFAMLTPAAWLQRPIPLRHPFIFYLGHLPAFAWNQVSGGLLERGRFHPYFDELFERGIDPDDESSATAASVDEWPALEEILAYRDGVRREILASFDAVQARTGTDPLAAKGRVYNLVIEHELMHHETLMYMFEQLDHELKIRPKNLTPLPQGPLRHAEPVEIPGGHVTLGADFDEAPFGWDNEFPAQRVAVDAFTLDSLPVTWAAFRDFVEDDGYTKQKLWSPEDWSWLHQSGRQAPLNWSRQGSDWQCRTTFADLPFDAVAGWPAHVSLAEAMAYCRWRGARLPTEAELHRAAYGTPDGSERLYPWGDEAPQEYHGNFAWHYFSPVSAGLYPAGASAWGVEELLGNGWEWTSTLFRGLPGFTPYARTYSGYSQDFFDDVHHVIFGAAWPTDEAFLRRSFRNWFQRRYPYVFATFRCVAAD